MKKALSFKPELIAECGMNCGICARYLAKAKDVKKKGLPIVYCEGCKPSGRVCVIKRSCKLLLKHKVEYCYECGDFPCRRLKVTDKRYRAHYRMSMIDNLEYIKKNGISKFLKMQEKLWGCPECGGVISCHNGICFTCGIDKLSKLKKLYRWQES